MNSKTPEMKNTLEGIDRRMTWEEGQISELGNRMMEIPATEKNSEKE